MRSCQVPASAPEKSIRASSHGPGPSHPARYRHADPDLAIFSAHDPILYEKVRAEV
jgi:hypothetical protein